MINGDKHFIGLMSELVLVYDTEEKQDAALFKIAAEWKDRGYTVRSGKVAEGKVDEIWAVKSDLLTPNRRKSHDVGMGIRKT